MIKSLKDSLSKKFKFADQQPNTVRIAVRCLNGAIIEHNFNSNEVTKVNRCNNVLAMNVDC